jgi:hypothetical protein
VQGRPFKVADGDVKPAIVLLRQIQNNYSISITLVDDVRACERFSFTQLLIHTPPFVEAGLLAMVVNDDAFILEKTRRLQVHRQQAGSCRSARSFEISSAVMFATKLVS